MAKRSPMLGSGDCATKLQGMEEQLERSFQTQRNHVHLSGQFGKRQGQRWYRDIGLGFETPKEAIEDTYVDKKCPFTGNVSIRGRILKGKVVSTKMKRTVVVRREYLQYIPKYNRYEKRHSNMPAHCSPCFVGIQEGDMVTIGECRPLSKTVRFNVIKVHKKGSGEAKKEKQPKSFSKF